VPALADRPTPTGESAGIHLAIGSEIFAAIFVDWVGVVNVDCL